MQQPIQTHRQRTLATIRLVVALVCSAMHAVATQVLFDQSTDPAGFFASSVYVTAGSAVTTTIAPMTQSGYSFTGWTLNGVRQQDVTGRALNPVTFTNYEDTYAVAHYTNTTADANADGVPDWFALLYYGSLTNAATSDTDGDGYSLLAEYQRDTDPLICDRIVAGGISRRRAATVSMNLAGYSQYTISCNPAGLFDVQSGAVPTGTVIQTASLSGANNGYTFAYWTLNGVRQADALGRALNQVAFTVTTDTVAVACYFANGADTDGDGIPDWWEGLYFGALTNAATADPDGDGYNLAAEYSRDTSPLIVDNIVTGGVSRRRADVTLVNLAGFCRYEIDCNPAGLFNTQVGAVATGTVVRTASLSGATSGYTFGYWTVNDVRQADVLGRAFNQVTFTVTTDTIVVAHYFASAQDTDGDGLPDWWEWFYFGTLTNGPSADPNGDGLTLIAEYARDLDPNVANRIVAGGISRRRSEVATINMQAFEHVQYALVDNVLTNFFPFWAADATGRSFGTNTAPAVGDWDGDGAPDLFVGAGGGQLTIYQNIGSRYTLNLSDRTAAFAGLAARWNSIPNPVPALGDWDGDGRADLAVGGDVNAIHLVAAAGTFDTPQASAANYDLPIDGTTTALPAFGRITGGTNVDLLVLLDDGSVRLYPNTGHAAQPFVEGQYQDNLLGTDVPQGTGMAVADVNRDGYPDVLVADSQGRVWVFYGGINGFVLNNKVWAGTGCGFATRLTLAAADLDGDGDIDALTGFAGGRLVCLRDPSVGVPGNVRAFAGAASIRVTWNPNREYRISGYYVYRAATPDGPFTNMIPVMLAAPEFLDSSVNVGETWYYRVTALTMTMRPGSTVSTPVESAPSEIVSATCGALTLTLPDYIGSAGTTTVLSVCLSNARGVVGHGMELHILYNPAVEKPASQVNTNTPTVLRTLLTQSLSLSDNAATANGELVIQGSGLSPITGEGRLFDIVWAVAAGLATGMQATNNVSVATLQDADGHVLVVDHSDAAVLTVRTAYIRGDVNGDGLVTQDDFNLAMQLVVGVRAPTAQELKAGDLNGNGRIDKDDAHLILRMIHGKTVNPP